MKFVGSCRGCGDKALHAPHVTGSYSTVVYGRLNHFCPGSPAADLKQRGNAHLPDILIVREAKSLAKQ